MTRLAIAVVVLVTSGCASQSPSRPAGNPPAFPSLANPGFEADHPATRNCPPQWGCNMHADGTAFRFAADATTAAEGARSLRVERLKPEPWATVTQSFKAQDLRGERLRFSIAVRTEGVSGEGAGPWLLVQGGGEVLDHQARRVAGTNGWQRLSIEIVVPAKAEYLSVGGTLEGGGNAWFDDARLEWLGPAAR